MKNIEKCLFVLMLGAIAACTTTPEQSPPIERLSISELIHQANGAPVTIDLRQEGVVYHAEHGLDLTGVTLVCPNNQQMPFAAWVDAQSSEFSINYKNLDNGFSVLKGTSKSGPKVSNLAAPIDCPIGCRPCTDGGCICDF